MTLTSGKTYVYRPVLSKRGILAQSQFVVFVRLDKRGRARIKIQERWKTIIKIVAARYLHEPIEGL